MQTRHALRVREKGRARRWRQMRVEGIQPTRGEMLYELICDPTDRYRRTHRRTYSGGTAHPDPDKPAPAWVTPRGVDQTSLYMHQIAHTVHYATGEPHAHSQASAARPVQIRLLRSRRSA